MKIITQTITNIMLTAVAGVVFALVSSIAIAVPKTICVFDPIGSNGPLYAELKDYATAAIGWGVEFKMKPYTDERIASEDFKSGLCDAVSVTGIRGRQFNPFVGSIDSVGALPSYDLLRDTVKTLSSTKAARLMNVGDYEVVGIFPGGAVYLFVNDRSINNVASMSGKKIAILDYDAAQIEIVKKVGASSVGSSLANMYSKFNNGSVDIVYGPGIMYEAMELYKGMEPDGGIIRFALAQLTIQVLIKSADFPEGYGQQSRDYVLSRFDHGVKILVDAENKIPATWWYDIEATDISNYIELFRNIRISLRDAGIYDPKMMTVLRKIRCRKDPEKSECTAANKE
ncbi:MAG: hypothetical protein JKY67_03915 [Pseudomonadales bacterium]|nr:hypothetical protein [Pseudomonadales bacterium]